MPFKVVLILIKCIYGIYAFSCTFSVFYSRRGGECARVGGEGDCRRDDGDLVDGSREYVRDKVVL